LAAIPSIANSRNINTKLSIPVSFFVFRFGPQVIYFPFKFAKPHRIAKYIPGISCLNTRKDIGKGDFQDYNAAACVCFPSENQVL
jgi:hypothetical protein